MPVRTPSTAAITGAGDRHRRKDSGSSSPNTTYSIAPDAPPSVSICRPGPIVPRQKPKTAPSTVGAPAAAVVRTARPLLAPPAAKGTATAIPSGMLWSPITSAIIRPSCPLWQVVQGNSGCHHHTCQKEPSPLRTCLQPAYQLLQEPDPPAARQYAGRCRRKRGEPWPRLNGIGQQVCTHHSKHHARRKAQQHTHGPVRTSAEQIGGQAPQPGPSHACRGRDSYDRTHNLLSLP